MDVIFNWRGSALEQHRIDQERRNYRQECVRADNTKNNHDATTSAAKNTTSRWTSYSNATNLDLSVLKGIPHNMIPGQEDMKLLLNKEFDQLSAQDKHRLRSDLYGDQQIDKESCPKEDQVVDDDNENLAHALAEFDIVLQNISNKQAYNMAALQNIDYVQDRKFCLAFLKAEEMSPRQAACRFVRFFEIKLDLFGEHLLTKDITLDDLNRQDLDHLNSGWMQLIPEKDRYGRNVIVCFAQTRPHGNVKNLVRGIFYILCAELFRDLSAQQKGHVMIIYNVGDAPFECRESMMYGAKILNSIPMIVRSLLYCCNVSKVLLTVPLIQLAVGKQVRLRFKVLFGSHLECQYVLDSNYGISNKTFPMTFDGQLLKDSFNKWLDAMSKYERTAARDYNDNDNKCDFDNHVTEMLKHEEIQPATTSQDLWLDEIQPIPLPSLTQASVNDCRGVHSQLMTNEQLLIPLSPNFNDEGMNWDKRLMSEPILDDDTESLDADNFVDSLLTEQDSLNPFLSPPCPADNELASCTLDEWMMDATTNGNNSCDGKSRLIPSEENHFQKESFILPAVATPCAPVFVKSDNTPSSNAPSVSNKDSIHSKTDSETAKKSFQPLQTGDIVVRPAARHILLGRGLGVRFHGGNIWYHEILDACRDRYEAASRSGKSKISYEIVDDIKQQGGVFLKQIDGPKKGKGPSITQAPGGEWVVVGESIARAKVAHDFRTKRNPK